MTLRALQVGFVFLAIGATPAAADLISGRAEVRAGGAIGEGLVGERKDDAFRDGATGAQYGALIGVEVLFIDGWIQHDQFASGDGLSGTWTQFMLGFDLELDLGDDALPDASGAAAKSPWFAELGMGLGFGVGTGRQVDPPLDNSEVTDKGLVFEGRLGVGYRLTSFLSAGLTVPLQTGYFIKSGDDVVANDVDNHYVDMSAGLLVNLRANIELY